MIWIRWAVVCLFFVGGCSSPHEPAVDVGSDSEQLSSVIEPWFSERAVAAGFDFRHVSGHDEVHVFPEIMGGGVALFDTDGDGDLDIYCVQSGKLGAPGPMGANQLYVNDGTANFTNVTTDSGAGDTGYGMGVAAGDCDNDGDIDLYVTNVGANVLLLNQGNGQFVDATQSAGVGDEGWSTSAAFVDYDRDGDLDLYVCNYIQWSLAGDLRCRNGAGQPDYCNPTSYSSPQSDVLYRNEGDGRFTDVSAEAGIRSAFGNGLGVVCCDLNGDSLTDIFVANDGVDNQCWLNQGEGRFKDQAMLTGCAVDKNGKAKAGMGTCAADIDGDDDMDLLVVNLQAQSDSFFRNEGQFFVDDTPMIGLGTSTRSFTRFGVGWADFDNDGQWDLFQANGRVTLPDSVPKGQSDPYAEPNVLLLGDGKKFQLAEPGALPKIVRTSRAAGFGDLNNDGAIDIVVINKDDPAELLLNQNVSEGNWLLVRAKDANGRDAVGATLRFQIGQRTLRRDVNPHYSYLSSNDGRVHVGLGQAESVSHIEVQWLDGSRESFPCEGINRIITLSRGAGSVPNGS